MKIAKILGLIFVSIVVLFFALGQSSFVKNLMIKTVQSSLEERTGWHAEMGDVSLTLPFSGDVKNITLTDADGAAITIDHLSFRLSPFTLFRLGTGIKVPHFALEGIRLKPNAPPIEIDGSLLLSHNFDFIALKSDIDTGPILLTLDGSLSLSSGLFKVDYTVRGEVTKGTKLFFDKGYWSGQLQFEDDAQLVLNHIKGRSGILEADGHCRINKRMEFEGTMFHVRCHNLEALSPELSGKADATVVVIGSYKEPYISLKGSGSAFTFRGNPIEDVQAALTITCSHNLIEAEGNFIADDIDVACHFSYNEQFKMDRFAFEAPNTRLSGDLTLDLKSYALEGKCKGYTTELQRWSSLHGEGALECFLDHSEESGQQVGFKIELFQGKIEGVQMERASLKGALSHFWEHPSGRLQLEGDDILYGSHKMDHFQCTTELSEKPLWPFKVESNGELQGEAHMAATGKWNFETLIVETCRGKIMGYPFSFADNVQATLKEDTLSFSPLFVHIANGSLYIAVDNTPESLHTTFRLHDAPIDIFTLILPNLRADGLISADIFLFGEPENLQGQLKAHFRNVTIEEDAFEKLPPFQGNFRASLLENTLDVRATVTDIGEQPITVDARLPMKGTLSPPSFTFANDRPLFTKINASGPISPFLQLFAVDASNFGGETEMAMTVEGTLLQPKISGTVSLKNGYFESLESGAQFRNISARLEGDGEQLLLSELRGTCGENGTFEGYGAIQLSHINHFPFAMDVTLNQIDLVNLSDAEATMTGDLHFRGNLHQANLRGDLIADKMHMRIPENKPALTHYVELEYQNQVDSEKPPTPYSETLPRWPVDLDLKLVAQNSIKITDPSLTSEWSGKAAIHGTAHVPIIEGELKLKKGSYRFRGRDLKLEEGSITFPNVPFEKGKLYVVASMDMKGIIVEVISKGEMMDPGLTLRSKPPLSQREILSRMVFNKSLSDITPFQSKEIAKSIKNLNKTSASDPLETLQKTVGIDRIDIAQTEYQGTQDVSVEVGKYITDSTVLLVRKNVNTEGNQFGIETNLSDHIKLQAEYSNDKTGQVNLLWKNDY